MRVAAAGADGLSGLADYLRPVPIAGEALRFDLSTYRSRLTREMLQVRLRMTPAAFALGAHLLPANLTGDALEVDADGLDAANTEVRRRLESGPEWPVRYLRDLHAAGQALDRQARRFARRATGERPSPQIVVAYVLAGAQYQALGALKFCLPPLDHLDMAGALLAPDGPTLWSHVRARELSLARLRRRGPAERYRLRLERFRRSDGYLYAEDVDFRAHETLEALDDRIAAIALEEGPRLAEAHAADQARKREARRRFAEGGHDARLVSQVLLARALTGHEDRNRSAKMRLLRDLRDLAELTGLDIEHDGLGAFTGAVLRSS